MTMLVDAIMADGTHCTASIAMRTDWSIEVSLPDAAGGRAELRLHAVVPDADNSLLFLFSPVSPLAALAPGVMAGPLPANAAELLLYAPTVALRKCAEGFRLLSWQVWKELAAAPGRDYNAVSSLVESCQMSQVEDGSSDSESESQGALSQPCLDDVEEEVDDDEDPCDDCEL